MNSEQREQRPQLESGFQPDGEDAGLNIQRYLQVLLKRKWLILGTLAVLLGAVAVWTFSRTRIYRATSTVLVDRQAPQVLGAEVREVVDTSMGQYYYRNKEYMETQIKVIQSKALALKVAETLRLHTRADFWGPAPARGGPVKPPTVDDAAAALRAITTASSARDANILEISVEHRSSELAAQLANAVATAYMDQTLEYKVSSTAGAVKWLADQLDDLKKQLEQAELALHEFKRKNNIVSVSLEDRQSLLAREMEKLNDALTEARMKRMSLTALRRQILSAREKDPLEMAVGPVTDSTPVQKLKETFVQEQQKYVALRERYLEKHPLVLEQKVKMDSAREALSREVRIVLGTVESRFNEQQDNETQLAAALQGAKDEALELNKRELEYRRLLRNQENNSKLYGMVLTRMKESDLSAQLRVSNIRLLDRAVEPLVPVRPNVRLNLMIGAMLGLLLGVGLAFLVDTLDNTVKSQDDVDLVPSLVFLGLMPRIPGAQAGSSRNDHRPDPRPEVELIVHRNPKSPVAESCRAIRTNLLFTSPDAPMKKIVITSPGPREGKTTTAVSLAIAMAQAGNRVLLLDTDMRRPRLHRVFGVPGSEGITSVLLGDARLEATIKSTEVPDLFVLPSGPTPPNPAEICQSDRFQALLQDLAARFDRVILDSPPVMVVTDAVVLSTLADGTLIVARTGQTTRGALRDSVRQVQDVGGTILGCVLNDVDLEKRGYGYYRYRRYGYSRYGYSRYGYGGYGDAKEEEAAS